MKSNAARRTPLAGAPFAPSVPVNQHYQQLRTDWVELSEPATSPDPLGFQLDRMLQGEAEVAAGRSRPMDDVLNALRDQVRRHRG